MTYWRLIPTFLRVVVRASHRNKLHRRLRIRIIHIIGELRLPGGVITHIQMFADRGLMNAAVQRVLG